MSVLIKGMEMPERCAKCFLKQSCNKRIYMERRPDNCPLVPVPPHGRLIKRIVYRGEVYNAIEAARVNALDGILSDSYKDGFHDGLKRALEILANVEDAPTIIPAEEGE